MRLPNAEHAIVDIRKLRDYCLNPDHPEGRHKARVFRAALGITQADAMLLQRALHDSASQSDAAVELGEDRYGTRYSLDFEMRVGARWAVVRSGWVVLRSDEIPRLTTCYVLQTEEEGQ